MASPVAEILHPRTSERVGVSCCVPLAVREFVCPFRCSAVAARYVHPYNHHNVSLSIVPLFCVNAKQCFVRSWSAHDRVWFESRCNLGL